MIEIRAKTDHRLSHLPNGILGHMEMQEQSNNKEYTLNTPIQRHYDSLTLNTVNIGLEHENI